MKALGIDVGSMTTKVVILDDSGILFEATIPIGDDTSSSVKTAVKEALNHVGLTSTDDLPIVSTGVGRKYAPDGLTLQQKSIPACLARGVNLLLPTVRTIIDVGAESITVLTLDESGLVDNWVNHDKCASGTGLFLEQMAKILQMPIEQMSALSLTAKSKADIASTCVVFAESEVISHLHHVPPTPKAEIAAGIYSSVASRIISLCKRIGVRKDVAMVGGVALNKGVARALEDEMGFGLLIPDSPQVIAALGAAIIAKESAKKELDK